MGHLTQCILLKNNIEPYAQKCCLYTANAVDYVIAEWEFEARHFAMTFVCTYVYVCMVMIMYIIMHHTFNCHICFWSTSGTTENRLHHMAPRRTQL